MMLVQTAPSNVGDRWSKSPGVYWENGDARAFRGYTGPVLCHDYERVI